MYKGEIPFDKNTGNLIWHLDWMTEKNAEMADNIVFTSTLQVLDKVIAGGSTKHLLVATDTGNEHVMFVKDFVQAAIKYGVSPGGTMTGEWCFCKRGANYGICMAD